MQPTELNKGAWLDLRSSNARSKLLYRNGQYLGVIASIRQDDDSITIFLDNEQRYTFNKRFDELWKEERIYHISASTTGYTIR